MRIIDRLLISVLILAFAGSVPGQSRDPHEPREDTVIASGFRVEGGLVNLTEGEVVCLCSGVPTRGVQGGQSLKNGDILRIDGKGRAEILLNPGYYLRLFNNTQATLLDVSPGNLKIKLSRGTAIFEIAVNGWSDRYKIQELLFDSVTVITPRDEYAIIRGGAYRFNVDADANSDVTVLRGVVVVAGSRVTDGKTASMRSGRPAVAPVSETAADKFDNWSRDRGVYLVQANKSLARMSWYKKMQDEDAYITILDPADPARADAMSTISARNGVVSFVEKGAILRSGEPAWQELGAGDNLTDGDRVRIAPESRAEIHPYANFSLYLGADTEIAYSEQADGEVSVTILRGSAVIIPAYDPKAKERNTLLLIAAQTEYRIADRGTYRINVLSEGRSEMLVYDGVVRVGDQEIKGRKRIVRPVSGESEFSLDPLSQDSLDIWSNKRYALGPARRLRRLMSVGGLWFLSKSAHQYTFVPGGWAFNSPYGGGYSIRYNPGRTMR
jgi:hypothetical protein